MIEARMKIMTHNMVVFSLNVGTLVLIIDNV